MIGTVSRKRCSSFLSTAVISLFLSLQYFKLAIPTMPVSYFSFLFTKGNNKVKLLSKHLLLMANKVTALIYATEHTDVNHLVFKSIFTLNMHHANSSGNIF